MEVRCKSLECGATFQRSPEDTGRIVHCPECGEPTEIPASYESCHIGRRIGDCEIVRRIAKGGMGEVYEAIQTRLDRRVAIKILSPQLASNEAFISRFIREAKAAASLNHPHIVQVHDFGKEGQEYYLVMEFVEGEDLSRHVTHHGALSVADTLRLALQTAKALSEARQKGIIHRDIKPANLLLNARGDIKVSDMGLAKDLTEDLELTATGIGIGSPHFIAPEQADDAKTVDHRADIYSLGISMMYMLTGKKPFEGSSAFSVVLAHASKPLPSGQELGTELPDHVEQLIQRMTAKDPSARYPDYTSLISDLHRVSEGMAPAFSPEAGTTETIFLPPWQLGAICPDTGRGETRGCPVRQNARQAGCSGGCDVSGVGDRGHHSLARFREEVIRTSKGGSSSRRACRTSSHASKRGRRCIHSRGDANLGRIARPTFHHATGPATCSFGQYPSRPSH